MLFLNPWLLAGLVGVSIPIIIHLVRQQAAKPIDWGAMRFLFDTLAIRRRRMQWEDLLLMAARCLLLGLLALALVGLAELDVQRFARALFEDRVTHGVVLALGRAVASATAATRFVLRLVTHVPPPLR